MRTMKGPGIFLSQFIGGEAPFNTLDGLAGWAAGKGYKAVQIPCNHPHIFDVEKAAESQAYCDDITARLAAPLPCISQSMPKDSARFATFSVGEMPPTPFDPARRMSQAPALIQSARLWCFPPRLSGPITGIERFSASHA